ncbi:type IV secretory system conjugative DNA transfer family protein [Gloeothece verrucosa]|uniref:TRAG family protein n=1 Tax=Gloeothece verrucosa (strain PCC 7822) TaxID=497965 RepID=E0UNS9_GLOV7|nr:TraM recognition domain-containing protein [Gloeothece verrucosa]ADN18609.1 TRAG family protein [Gloeothece verrucosa PCC 7822]
MSYYIGQSSTPPIPTSSITNFLNTPSGLALLGSVAAFGLLSLLDDSNKKGKLATSYWGSGKEKRFAARRAALQIENPKRNSAALYLGMPDEVLLKLQQQWVLDNRKQFLKRKPSPNTFYVPDIQRGISVLGGAGTGKTFSVIDPLIRSALDQGFPTIIYDFKYPAQTCRAVAYALKRGYKIRIFAPGFPESDSCNILDFLKDAEDAVAAGQLAQTITKNCDISNGHASGDKFFEDAGATLVEGIFLLAKAVAAFKGKEYADLMTASAILSLPELGKRLLYAQQQSLFPIWTMRPLAQVISVSGSPETESSIVGTAQRTFQKFLKKDFIGSFCGESTLPLDLDGKTLVIFGLDRNNRDIVGPLLAATLHMVVSQNVSRVEPRRDPLCVFLDELPTIYLPQLQNWFNEAREDGFCGVIGAQNLGQLERIYGKELARIIFGGTATKYLFNPQDVESAKYFSEFLGEVEVKFDSKSRSKNTGKHGGGGSRSTSDNRQKRPLFEPAQFLKLPTGKAIVINPAYRRGGDNYVPILQKIHVARCERAEMEWSESRWPFILKYLRETRANHVTDEMRRSQFEERLALVDELFPLPPENSHNNVRGQQQNPKRNQQQLSATVPTTNSQSSDSNINSIHDITC